MTPTSPVHTQPRIDEPVVLTYRLPADEPGRFTHRLDDAPPPQDLPPADDLQKWLDMCG